MHPPHIRAAKKADSEILRRCSHDITFGGHNAARRAAAHEAAREVVIEAVRKAVRKAVREAVREAASKKR